MGDDVRYLNKEIADAMCQQVSIESLRQQRWEDSKEIERLQRRVEELTDYIRRLEDALEDEGLELHFRQTAREDVSDG